MPDQIVADIGLVLLDPPGQETGRLAADLGEDDGAAVDGDLRQHLLVAELGGGEPDLAIILDHRLELVQRRQEADEQRPVIRPRRTQRDHGPPASERPAG